MGNDFLEGLFRLEGKTVLITGVAGQLGRKFSKAFLDAGATVFGADIKFDAKKMSVGDRIKYLEMDIADKKSVITAFDKVYEECGKLDILVNNAGVSTFEPFEKRPEESFDWVMDVNLKGTFFCMQTYANRLKEKKQKGSIINIGSIYGVISPDPRIYTDCDRKNSEVYGATKAGIIQMTKYFAAHLAKDGIRVNCISPGGIFNPEAPQGKDFVENYSYRCPMGRMAEAGEMVGALLYLSSDSASYTTGQNIVVDGGMSCW